MTPAPERTTLQAALARARVVGMVAAVALAGCHREPSAPGPQSEQQVGAEAERRAASIEAEMNRNADSENIAKKPGDEASQPPEPPPALPPPVPTQPPPPQ